MKKTAFIVLALTLLLMTAGPALASEGGYSDAQIKDLVLRVMNFVAFFAILFFLLRRPVGRFFLNRRESIERNLNYLETQARNLEEQTEILNREIADIASERDAILAQYERLGKKEADRIIAEAKASAEAIIQKTQAAMDQELKTARQALLRDIVKLSTQAATELITTNITTDDQKRLTSEFKEQVEKMKMAG